jgi:hypothetical protein
MAAKPNPRLAELLRKANVDGRWSLAAAVHQALGEESNLDYQINVVGALHETGSLRNVLEPFWKLWRKDDSAWTARCVERLRSSDRDYWAVAALLGIDIRKALPVFKSAGYVIQSVRAVPPMVSPLTHFLTLALAKAGTSQDLWAPAVELGWDAKSGVITDAARWRAILFDEISKTGASATGKGSGTNFLRAVLPHGSWRLANMDFELAPEAVIPIEKTILKKA